MEISLKEKQAIEDIRERVEEYEHYDMATFFTKDVRKLFEIIDKQEKEIEDLKEELKIKSLVDLEEYLKKDLISVLGKAYISKDKIKEKIKELENLYKNKYDLYMGYKFESREQQDIEKQIEVLKELLGEE